MKFSLRSAMLAQLVVALILGWAVDHAYQSHMKKVLHQQSIMVVRSHKLRKAAAAARVADSNAAYGDTYLEATGVMLDVTLGEPDADASCLIAAYIDAMRVPDWDHRADEPYLEGSSSIGGEACVALAAVGPEAVPAILGLLYDEDPQVRRRAAVSLTYLTAGLNARANPLPRPVARKMLLVPVREALAREVDKEVARELTVVLRSLE